ncbi:MAG: hypothetical protein GEU99_03350 [Luteitalea sp.]|nr:hypothetical protein [Luteitalea sp.]
MRHARDGTVLDVGRKRRTIPPAIRRALTARDRRCRFPGCTARHCEAHHVQHWSEGGATRLTNLALLCKRHHRAVHEEGFTLTLGADGTVGVCRPDGATEQRSTRAPARHDRSRGSPSGRLYPNNAGSIFCLPHRPIGRCAGTAVHPSVRRSARKRRP